MPPLFSYPEEAYLLIGEVIKAQGLRGELKLACYSGQPENLSRYRRLALVGGNAAPRMFALEGSRAKDKAAIVRLQGVADRDQAEFFVGYGVLVPREDLPPPGDGEFYWQDLIGRRVEDTAGRAIGTVSQLFSNGSHDTMVIVDAGREFLVPAVSGILVAIREDAIIIDPPPGLLEINEPGE